MQNDHSAPTSLKPFYQKLALESQRIASKFRVPEFYRQFRVQYSVSKKLFFNHPMVVYVKNLVRPRLKDGFGHGLDHSTRVGIDAATIVCLEAEKYASVGDRLERLMVLSEIAGLLHDIHRGEENHAREGARSAKKILKHFPIRKKEINWISCAIANHEAFKVHSPCPLPWGQLLSDALYDADKFRWGPDNFTKTVWFMVNYKNIPLEEVVRKFPWGVNGVLKIKETFRTSIGQQFGPDIIDVGVEIGKEIYRYLLDFYKEYQKADENDKRHDNRY